MAAKNPQRRELKRQILKLTNGIFATTTDFTLFALFLTLSRPGKPPTSRGINQAADEADEILKTINYKSIKNALYNLKKKGLIKSARQAFLEPAITEAGLTRIYETIPNYDTKRVWDKMIYLISYDIPREHNAYRTKLRQTLYKFRTAQLHHSLYLTPYNPKGVLEDFTEEYGLYGDILISTLSEDSQIGDEKNLKDLLWGYFNLDYVNEGYEDFITHYRHLRPNKETTTTAALAFLSAVRDDPQLPFELLPTRYLGDKAYLLYRRLTGLD